MITTTPQDYDSSKMFDDDIGRPTLYEGDHFEIWDRIFDYIEKTPIKIVPNGLYDNMREMCANRQSYGGGGFKFMFWFFSEEDRDTFHKEVREIARLDKPEKDDQ